MTWETSLVNSKDPGVTWDTCQQQEARGDLGHLSTARSQGRPGTLVNSKEPGATWDTSLVNNKEPGATWDTCQCFIQSVLLAVTSERKFLKKQKQKQTKNVFFQINGAFCNKILDFPIVSVYFKPLLAVSQKPF